MNPKQLEKEEILSEKQTVGKSFPKGHLFRPPSYHGHYVPNITCYLVTVSLFGSLWPFELSEVRNWACSYNGQLNDTLTQTGIAATGMLVTGF